MTPHRPFPWGLLLAALLPLTAQALPERTWLVAIGHDQGSRGEVGLLYAESDARAFADVLRTQGRVSSQRTVLMLGEDAASVRRAIQDVIATLRAQVGEGHATALVVFYSGHADATALHLGGTELPLEELKSLVEGSAAGVRVLVLDACRSGAVTRVKGVNATEPFRITLRDDLASEGMAILTSSAAGESSQESDELRGSFFTHHLVNALRGAADHDDDGKVTLTEACSYAYTQTLRSSGQTVALQHPTYSWDVKGRGDLVLSNPSGSPGRMGRLRLGASALYLLMEGRRGGAVVAEVEPEGTLRELSLPAGHYFVQRRDRDEYREYQVTLAAGGLVELASLPFETVRLEQPSTQRRAEYYRSFEMHLFDEPGDELLSTAPSGARYGIALVGACLDANHNGHKDASEPFVGSSPIHRSPPARGVASRLPPPGVSGPRAAQGPRARGRWGLRRTARNRMQIQRGLWGRNVPHRREPSLA